MSILLHEAADVNIKPVPASNLSLKEPDDQAKRNDHAKNRMMSDGPLDEEDSPIETKITELRPKITKLRLRPKITQE